jgi:hypothetical protein
LDGHAAGRPDPEEIHDRPEGWLKDVEAQQPMGQLVKPDQLAGLVAYMLSPESGVMTGALVDYDRTLPGVIRNRQALRIDRDVSATAELLLRDLGPREAYLCPMNPAQKSMPVRRLHGGDRRAGRRSGPRQHADGLARRAIALRQRPRLACRRDAADRQRPPCPHGGCTARHGQAWGRHRYYKLASAKVASMLETIYQVAGDQPQPRRRLPSYVDTAMREARTCYDHLAGELGVAVAERWSRERYSCWR